MWIFFSESDERFGLGGGLGGSGAARAVAVAVAVHLDDVDVVGQPVEQRAGKALGADDLVPSRSWLELRVA